MPSQEPLVGFGEMVEPIKVVEIGCGVSSSGKPHDYGSGRIYDLPHVYKAIERQEEFIDSTGYLKEDEKNEVRLRAEEAGIIFGNAADLPFPDASIDVVTMRSVFGQFTDKDYREFDNVRRFGLMEAFRVLRPNGIIAISEENTPWDEDNVFHYLNNLGFTIIDYAAMQRDWRAPDRRGYAGRSIGDFRNIYAPENEAWLKRLGQFYGDEFGMDFLSTPRQYLMVAQKQQPATIEQTLEWQEWSVSEDRYDHADSESTRKQKTYKYGQPVKQEYLPGMYHENRGYPEQEGLFYLPSRYFF